MRGKRKPALGQNFLADTAAQRRIVEALGGAADGDVVEIGPGKAAITELLAARARRLMAIELDPALAAALRARFHDRPSVEVLEADVLSVDLAALALEPGRSLAVIGNLPYYITSPILRRLFLFESSICRAVVLVQREVAERMTAEPGSREYGLLSVLCRLHAQTQLLFTLPPEAFSPPPGVYSAVARMEFAPLWAELDIEPASFGRFLEQCFAQKRKTLANNLRAAGYPAPQVGFALAPFGGSVRAEELSPAELASVYRRLRT